MDRMSRIAADVADDMVVDRKSFREWVEDELYDELDSLGEWQGFDAYNADTNGNDHLYQLHVFADDEYVRYADESYSDAYYEQGDDWELEVDDSRLYPYSKFPFSKKEFKEWLSKSVQDGIKAGREALNEKPEKKDDFERQLDELQVGLGCVEDKEKGTLIFKCNIPEWSVSYLVNGDDSGLDDDEKDEVDHWKERNDVVLVDPTNEESGFTTDTEFGDAGNCIVCFVHVKCK